ncbi:MAG: hypothetical protein K2X77_06250 [Candidatus Obscuribacterales bacterium]|jgi:hypothetical protein|nr:hypothetical protein [Candidatus Obscuribacterales bacterium]
MTLGQPSQPEGDKLRTRTESAASNVQEQAENIERQQATKQLAAGEANKPVNDDNNEKKRLGKSRATNKLIDENGRGLASAQDLLGAAAHMTRF